MESLTLALFVLGLLIVALFVTQTVRRDIKMRTQFEGDLRRNSLHARLNAVERTARTQQAAIVQQHAHRPPHNSA
jgi:hypothetical protein